MVDSALETKYYEIKEALAAQTEQYKNFLSELPSTYVTSLEASLKDTIGLGVNFENGRIYYLPSFSPLSLNYDICYVRHGKTAGNTEPRVYQGQVDYENNQLNAIGLQQAEDAADEMEKELIQKNRRVALVVTSPLTRATKTAEAFTKRHQEIPVLVMEDLKEMSFGEWDNVMVKDLDKNSMGHLFYLEQNAIVKAAKPHVSPKKGSIVSENVAELILREREALLEIGKHPAVLTEEDRLKKEEEGGDAAAAAATNTKKTKPLVVIYGHSMAGAAILILLGCGKADEKGLGFDGGYILKNASPTFIEPNFPNLQ